MQVTYLSAARYGCPLTSRANQSGCALKKSSAVRFESMRAITNNAVGVGGLRQLAEEIALAQELGTMVQRKLARIVGDDATGVDDDGLGLRALPVPRHQSMS